MTAGTGRGVVFTVPRGLRLILGYSFVLTVARAATLPFLAVWLSRSLGLTIESIGLVLTVSLVLGTVAGLGGGYLVDRLDRSRLLLAVAIATAGLFALLPMLGSVLAVAAALSILNAVLAVASIAVKAAISDLLPPDRRVRAFSINYTLVNVGFAVGPLLSVFLAGRSDVLAFWLAAGLSGCAALVAVAGRRGTDPQRVPRKRNPSMPDLQRTWDCLRQDRLLLLITLGSMLSAIVYDQFSAWLSQYLITRIPEDEAYRMIGQLVTVNAIVVIATQYMLSRHITRERLLSFVLAGSACLVAGLLGFGASPLPVVWFAAMAVFTLGEVMLVPSEYLFVDHIAPEALRGTYYAVHNLTALGGAASPMLCGALLAAGGAGAMFAVLLSCTVFGAGLFVVASRSMVRRRPGEEGGG